MNPNEVKELRKSLGITQRQLADKLGTTTKTVFLWEQGVHRPRRGMVEKMQAMLPR